MEHHIEPRVLLLAAERIRELGEERAGERVYEQIHLSISYDGYTVTLRDNLVSITLYFHNKVKAEYASMDALEAFYGRLRRLCAESD